MAYGYVYPGYVSLAVVVIFAMVTRRVAGKAAPRPRLPPRVGGVWSREIARAGITKAWNPRESHAGESQEQLPLRHAQMPDYPYSRDGEAGVLRGGWERRGARGPGPQQPEPASSGKLEPPLSTDVPESAFVLAKFCTSLKIRSSTRQRFFFILFYIPFFFHRRKWTARDLKVASVSSIARFLHLTPSSSCKACTNLCIANSKCITSRNFHPRYVIVRENGLSANSLPLELFGLDCRISERQREARRRRKPQPIFPRNVNWRSVVNDVDWWDFRLTVAFIARSYCPRRGNNRAYPPHDHSN